MAALPPTPAAAPEAGASVLPQMMRAACFNTTGGPEALQPCLWTRPKAAEGRVLVRVAAAGLNPIDCKTRAGAAFPFTPLLRLPKVPGGDLAGVVAQAPAGSRFKPGDRVFACTDAFFPHVGTPGSYAEYCSVAEGQLAAVPQGIPLDEAACVPLVALTAWQGLIDLPLPPGSRILVHGGSGGVGSMAVQMAKAVKGWHVTATCSPKNAAYCKGLGADVTKDYSDLSLYERYSSSNGGTTGAVGGDTFGAGGPCFDVVLDTVGGRTTRDCLRVLKARGHLVHVWTNAERWIKEAGSEVRGKAACVADLALIKLRGMAGLGPSLRLVLIHPDGEQLGEIAALLGQRKLHPPRIARAFPLDRASDAHAYFEGGHGAGKVLIKVAPLH